MEKNKFNIDFGLIIREKRCIIGWTQKQLAEKMSVGASYISMVESGAERPPASLIGKLAKMLRIDRRAVLNMLQEEFIRDTELAFNEGYDSVKPYTNFGKTLHP